MRSTTQLSSYTCIDTPAPAARSWKTCKQLRYVHVERIATLTRLGSVAVAVPAPTILCFAPLSIVTATLTMRRSSWACLGNPKPEQETIEGTNAQEKPAYQRRPTHIKVSVIKILIWSVFSRRGGQAGREAAAHDAAGVWNATQAVAIDPEERAQSISSQEQVQHQNAKNSQHVSQAQSTAAACNKQLLSIATK